MTSWRLFPFDKLISSSQPSNTNISKSINELFRKHRKLFYSEKLSREEWSKSGWYKYQSNPDKLILTHSSMSEYIFKLIHPLFIKPNDEDSQKIIRMNLSRVFVAREIRKYSLKWVTTPVKYIVFIDAIQQYIVVAQKMNDEDMQNTDKKLMALDQEHLDELFAVSEKVGFYDINPRNLAIVKSWEGDKIYIIDTENACEVTEENVEELRDNMRQQFSLFLKNHVHPSISPRYERRYSKDSKDLELTSPSVLLGSKTMIDHWERIAKRNSSKQIIEKIDPLQRDFEQRDAFRRKLKPYSSMIDLKAKSREAEDPKRHLEVPHVDSHDDLGRSISPDFTELHRLPLTKGSKIPTPKISHWPKPTNRQLIGEMKKSGRGVKIPSDIKERDESFFSHQIPAAPTFYPTVEEFQKPMAYIEKIRPIAEWYGICKVVPPPHSITSNIDKTNFRFTTKEQSIHLLQNRHPDGSPLKKRKLEMKSISIDSEEAFGYVEDDTVYTLPKFEKIASEFEKAHIGKRKSMSSTKFQLPQRLISKLARQGGRRRIKGINYLWSCKKKSDFTILDREFEYWRIVEGGDEPTFVQYGSDVDVMKSGSMFPKTFKSDWNLTRMAKADESWLKFLGQTIPGINSPMIYIGMLFSSFCWHTEDNYLYSTNYIHSGASKVWYGVPSFAAHKFESVMKTKLPNLFGAQPDLIHGLVTMLSPTVLRDHGVPIYRLEHHAGEYVFTFPQAYHSGFNCGFNMAESINFGLPDWLSWGRRALDDYPKTKRGAHAFSHDELVYLALMDKDNLTKDFKKIAMVDFESLINREKKFLASVAKAGITKQIAIPDANRDGVNRKTKKERDINFCSFCNQACFFSGIGCKCKKTITCLTHYMHQCVDCKDKKQLNVLVRHSVVDLTKILKSIE